MANFNFNKVILGGRLTSDPELKQTNSGTFVCTFRVAIERRYHKDDEQTTDFINVIAWRQRAEFVSHYFRKGSSICIVGQIQTRSYDDKDGGKHKLTEIVADEIHFVDSKGETFDDGEPSGYEADALHFEDVTDDDDMPF